MPVLISGQSALMSMTTALNPRASRSVPGHSLQARAAPIHASVTTVGPHSENAPFTSKVLVEKISRCRKTVRRFHGTLGLISFKGFGRFAKTAESKTLWVPMQELIGHPGVPGLRAVEVLLYPHLHSLPTCVPPPAQISMSLPGPCQLSYRSPANELAGRLCQ